MVIPRPKTVHCTLCGAPFVMMMSAMVNPADVICDACIVDLWSSKETNAELMARCTAASTSDAAVSPSLGMSPDLVADAILERVKELRDIARTRAEVDGLLLQRAGASR